MAERRIVLRVASCPKCPLSRHGEEWSPFCEAPRQDGSRRSRALPRDHDSDGPPPQWCPARRGVVVLAEPSDG